MALTFGSDKENMTSRLHRAARISSALFFSVTTMASVSAGRAYAGTPAAKFQQAAPVTLNQYLIRMSVRLDFYYTTESLLSDRATPFLSAMVDDKGQINTLPDLVSFVEKAAPGTVVKIDDRNGNILHVLDARLLTLPNYSLEQKVSLTYSGYAEDLSDALGKYVPGVEAIKERRSGFLHWDYVDTVRLKADGLAGRTILSNCLPLSQYHRTLWQAETVNTAQPHTSVSFWGPVKRTSPAFFEPVYYQTQVIPFSAGEPAFRLNPDTPEIRNAALEFLKTAFTQVVPTQSRWAMFYLSRCGDERAIPFLIQHLDYSYGSSPIVQEQYPALRALCGLGQSAIEAALVALQTETDAKRQELLIRAVISVKGIADAKPLVEAVMGKLDAPQREQLTAALVKATTEGWTVTSEQDQPMTQNQAKATQQ